MDSGPIPPPPPPEHSPWARPAPGAEPPQWETPQFEVAAVAPPVVATTKRPWRIVGVVGLVVMVVVAGVLVVGRDRGGDEPAASAQRVTPEAPALTSAAPPTTAPATTALATTAPPTIATTTSTTTTSTTTTAPPATTVPIVVAPGTFDLELALAASNAATAQRTEMDIEFAGTTTSISTALDSEQRVSTEMQIGTELVEIIMDVPGEVAYMRAAAFTELATTDAEWIAFDLEELLAASGQNLDGLRQNLTGSTDAAASIAQLGPTPVGFGDVDGDRVLRFAVTLGPEEIERLASENPQFAAGSVTVQQLLTLDRIDYVLAVDEANTLRALEMEMTLDGMPFRSVMRFLPVEPDFVIALPDPATVERIELPAP